MSGFEDSLYNPQYYSIAPSQGPDEYDSQYAQTTHQQHGHGDPTATMTSSLMGYPQPDMHDLGGQFQNLYSTAYSHAQEDPAMFGTGGGPSTSISTNTMRPAHGYSMQGSTIDGSLPNVDFSYDDSWSGAGTSMPMALDATNPFAYTISNPYPMPLPLTSPMGLDPQAAYTTSFPTQSSVQNAYWGMDHFHSTPQQDQTVAQGQQLQDSQIYSQPYAPALAPPAAGASKRTLQPRAIQPKRQSPLSDRFPSHAKPESRTENSPYTNIYSTSGFDILGVLARVISRPDPKINIGAVDLSCAFVLCDITQDDHPIVYVSEAFGRMTGYSEEEIVGRNCRFLQSPYGNLKPGMERKFVDSHTVSRLRTTIEERNEIQASVINYRKGGQPFMNLITMIPVRWGEDYRFYVGFQVDLVEKPEAVTKKNPNGTYMINYQRHQLPNYVVPPPEVYRNHPDLAVQFSHTQVSAVLQSVGASRPEYKPYLDRILVENADDVIQVLSYDSVYLYLSPSCQKILEYDSVELVGKTLSTICHPSDIGSVTRELRASTTTAPLSVVHRIRKKNSGYTWFESHGSWHVEPGRGRTFLVLVGRERPTYCVDQITRLGVEALAENDLWAKLSTSGMILYISTKSKPVLGQTADELIGTTFEDLVRVEDRPEAQKALQKARSGRSAIFHYLICHKKGHMLQAQTALFPGDTKEGTKPSFLIAQVRFPKFTQPATRVGGVEGPTESTLSLLGGGDRKDSSNQPPSNNRQTSSSAQPAVFPELATARGSSWQFELREIERRNRTLSDELHRLMTRKKKRKRRQTALPVGKNCAMCQASNTPEWRRGPSGNRDLCNSCGLRWAKQVRSTTQSEKSGSS